MHIEELKQINEETKRSFNLIAEKYSELFRDEMKQKEYDRALLDRFAGNFDSESIICDVGCGPGHITRYLCARARVKQMIQLNIKPAMTPRIRLPENEMFDKRGERNCDAAVAISATRADS